MLEAEDDAKAGVAARLRSELLQEVLVEAARREAERADYCSEATPRDTNRKLLLASDIAMVRCFGWGLSEFTVKQVVMMILKEGEQFLEDYSPEQTGRRSSVCTRVSPSCVSRGQ